MSDYVPRSEGGLLQWLPNLKTKIAAQKAALALTDPQVTAVQTLCDSLVAAITAKNSKKAEYDQVLAQSGETLKTGLASLRQQANRWKTEPGYTPAIGAALQIIGGADTTDPQSLQPELTAAVERGHVVLRFKKWGADAVNLYKRKTGETDMKFLARDTNSPYDDYSPLEKPGVPENWEYQALAVIGDDEVGQPSAIVKVTFGG